jgi:hypothetical protein
MRKCLSYLLAFLVSGLWFMLESQSQVGDIAKVSGRVVDDSTGEPLPSANVFIANTTLGTVTNRDGDFEIRNVPLGNFEVVASFVGYQTQSAEVRLTKAGAVSILLRLKPRPIEYPQVEVEA